MKVYLRGANIGILKNEREGLTFSYLEDWLQNKKAYPLSNIFPLSRKIFPQKYVYNFFSNILPYGNLLEKLSHHTGLKIDNIYPLLKLVGRDCPGALMLSSEAIDLKLVNEYMRLGEKNIEGMLDNFPKWTFLLKNGRSATLSGAHAKIPIYYNQNKGMFLPTNGSLSNFIIKLQDRSFNYDLSNEHLVMTIAGKVGLPVVSSSFKKTSSRSFSYMLIERYDRRSDKKNILKSIHQEDMCQILGFSSQKRYTHQGGAAICDCIQTILNISTDPFIDIQFFLRWVIFNICIVNTDAHCKKISFIYHGNSTRLAPFYGLRSNLKYNTKKDFPLAMPIGKQYEIHKISISDWKLLASSFSIGIDELCETIKKLCDKVIFESKRILNLKNITEQNELLLKNIIKNCIFINSTLNN